MRTVSIGALLSLATASFGQLSYFEDFSDGLAQAWSSDQGIWAVENFYYHGVGQLVNNRWENVAYVETFGDQNVSVEADMHSDEGADNVSKMLVVRYQDPGDYLFLNFVAAPRNFFVVEQVVNGVRSRILPEFTHHLPSHGQTEWHHCRIDIDGTRVLAYFDNTEVFNSHIPQVLVRPGVVGAMTFSSPGGGDEELFMDDYRASYFDYTPFEGFTLGTGVVHSGTENSIAEPDGNHLVLRPGPVFGLGQPPIKVTFTGTNVVALPSELRLKLTGLVSGGVIRETVMLMNYQTNQFEVVRDANSTLINARKEIIVTNNASRFVSPVNGQVKATITYKSNGPVFTYPWSARIDYIAVTART